MEEFLKMVISLNIHVKLDEPVESVLCFNEKYICAIGGTICLDTHDQRNVWDIKVENLVH